MYVLSTFTHMGRNDARVISRDSFLITMVGYIVFLSVVMRFAMPWLNDFLITNGFEGFVLADFYPLVVTFFAIFMGAIASGMVVGFMLLDEREDNTIKAILVTPMPASVYVIYRVLLPMILAFVLVVVQMLIMNLAPVTLMQTLVIGVGAAFTAPIVSLFFATFAENKVQGFALTKFTGLAGMLIMGAYFVGEPVQYLFGLFPPYWISKAYWMALAGDAAMNSGWILAIGIGIVLQLALILALIRRFTHIAYK